MQRRQCLAVPVQVWEQQEAFVAGSAKRRAVDDIFDFGGAFDDVVDPLETAAGAFAFHVGADVRCVYLRCFVDEADALTAVFFDMGFGAGIDEIELQVRRELCGSSS